MTSTATKIQKLSDCVFEILSAHGLSKIFNWEDYHYFKKQTAGRQNPAQAIADLFLYWYSHEETDFAEYEF